jgi:hypothetical protein
MHLSCTDTNTISKQKEAEIPHVPHYLGVPSGASKTISEPYGTFGANRAPSCVKISTISKQTGWASTWASSTRGTIRCVQNNFRAYGTFGANRAPMLHRHQHCLQAYRSEILQDPHHLEVSSGASKKIFKAMVCLAQTMHLSCIKISTISK